MFGKNKKSLLVLIISFFWLGYVSLTALQFYSQANKLSDYLIETRRNNMEFVLSSFASSLVNTHTDSLKDKLSQARKVHLIDFFILQDGTEPVFFEVNTGKLESVNRNYVNFNRLIEVGGLTLKTVKVLDYRLTVGINTDKPGTIKQTLWDMMPLFIKDIAIVTGILTLICYLVLKDIINLSKTLSSRSRSDITKIKTRSAEAETLVKASLGLEGERVRLERLSETYGETVGPAIRHELNSDKEAPYNFPATLSRVDLNGYTQIFLEKDDSYLTSILNQYFERARETIERYNGLIYQFVGDEIVFIFKDEMSPDLSTESLATACIRDLFAEAALIEQGLPEGANHYFKLKGSFAKGSMRFTQLDEGHAMSGLPLIESVRLLSLIDEKSHQVLAFFQESQAQTEGLAFIFDRKENHLKGFKEASLICRARDFNSIEWIFESNQWKQLSYFRSDAHTIAILKRLRMMAVSKRDDDIMQILMALKYHKFAQTSADLAREAELTLNTFLTGEAEDLLSTKSLSATVSLVGRLIPKDLWNESLQKSVTALLTHKDPRVQANAIVVLGRYEYPARKIWDKMFSQNNRLAADTIMEVAKQQLNDEVIEALGRLLSSSTPVYVRSGEYARNQILKYYSEVDPVFAKTSPYLIKLRQLKASKAA